MSANSPAVAQFRNGTGDLAQRAGDVEQARSRQLPSLNSSALPVVRHDRSPHRWHLHGPAQCGCHPACSRQARWRARTEHAPSKHTSGVAERRVHRCW